MGAYVLAGGVQWCTTHYGIVDELNSDSETCDLHHDGSRRPVVCHIVDLYFLDDPDDLPDDDEGE